METVIDSGPARATAPGGKYLTFCLAGEEYGIEILKVREVIGLLDITAVPQVPPYVKGVINLRGQVIPVIDLRLRCGLAPVEYDDLTCTVVVDVGALVGVIVDAVQEVLDIDRSAIVPPPPLGAAVDTSFVLGLAKVRDGVTILLDLDGVLGRAAIGEPEEATQYKTFGVTG